MLLSASEYAREREREFMLPLVWQVSRERERVSTLLSTSDQGRETETAV